MVFTNKDKIGIKNTVTKKAVFDSNKKMVSQIVAVKNN